jgi:hypothetical protein
LNFGADNEFTALAYCRDQKLKTKSKSVEVGPISSGVPTSGTVIAKCKQGTTAFSGGFDNPDFFVSGMGGATAVFTQESRKVGKRKWRVTGSNAGSVAGELAAQVNCHEGKGLETREKSETLDATSGPDQAELVAKCKRGERVVSGGFRSDQAVFNLGEGELILITESRKQGKRKWIVSATASGGTPAMTAYAYCEEA